MKTENIVALCRFLHERTRLTKATIYKNCALSPEILRILEVLGNAETELRKTVTLSTNLHNAEKLREEARKKKRPPIVKF